MFEFNMKLFHKPPAYMRAYRAKKKAEGGGKTASIENGFNGQWHGVSITANNKTNTIFFDGNGHMKNELGEIAFDVPGGRTSADVVRINKAKGYKVEVITPAQYNKMAEEYAAEREARDKIDYALGAGVPWGNADHRRVARRQRIIDRVQRRKGW